MGKVIKNIILILILFMIVKCSHQMYVGSTNFPEYASSEALTKKYSNLIAAIDGEVKDAETSLSLGASLEKINYPENIVYVAIQTHSSGTIIVKSTPLLSSSSRSIFTKNGFGYGKLGSQEIEIITRPVKKLDIKHVVVYLAY